MRSLMFQEQELAARYPPTCDPPEGKHHPRNTSAINLEHSHMNREDKTGVFPAMCEFWVLTSEWTTVYYATPEVPASRRVPIEFARETFQKLLNWSDKLTAMMARGDQNRHQNTTLQ